MQGQAKLSSTTGLAEATFAEPRPSFASRVGRFISNLILGFVKFVFVLTLGAAAAVYFLYLPARLELVNTRAEVEAAQLKVAELEGEISRLAPADGQQDLLLRELETARFQKVVYQAMADVNAARIALAVEDTALAKIKLEGLEKELASIAEQSDHVPALQSRLGLVLGEIDANPAAAASDLELLAANLEVTALTFGASE